MGLNTQRREAYNCYCALTRLFTMNTSLFCGNLSNSSLYTKWQHVVTNISRHVGENHMCKYNLQENKRCPSYLIQIQLCCCHHKLMFSKLILERDGHLISIYTTCQIQNVKGSYCIALTILVVASEAVNSPFWIRIKDNNILCHDAVGLTGENQMILIAVS